MKEQMEMKELLVEINNAVDFNRELRWCKLCDKGDDPKEVKAVHPE